MAYKASLGMVLAAACVLVAAGAIEGDGLSALPSPVTAAHGRSLLAGENCRAGGGIWCSTGSGSDSGYCSNTGFCAGDVAANTVDSYVPGTGDATRAVGSAVSNLFGRRLMSIEGDGPIAIPSPVTVTAHGRSLLAGENCRAGGGIWCSTGSGSDSGYCSNTGFCAGDVAANAVDSYVPGTGGATRAVGSAVSNLFGRRLKSA